MGRASALIAVALVLAGGCDGTHARGDATTGDTPLGDARGVDPNFAITAVYLDWDSTLASPCPIVGATWTAKYDDNRVATTDATGSFTIELASYLFELKVEQPSAPSTCATAAGTYDLPADAIVEPLIHYAGGHPVMRSLTSGRMSTFYSSIGSPFDATRGQLFVHIDGPARAVSIPSAHAAVQAFAGSSWSAGDTGTDVFFPNVTLAEPPLTTVTVAGGAMGTGSVVLTAGTITYVTVITN